MPNPRYDEFVAVRIRSDQKSRIRELAERHELTASIVVRKLLVLGLRRFEREAFRPRAKAAE